MLFRPLIGARAARAGVIATVTLLLLALLVGGCSGPSPAPAPSRDPALTTGNEGRYKHDKDFGPDEDVDLSHVPDAVPRVEQRTRAGNKNPYTVLGKTYYLMSDETSYKERGYASWYGKKFNGYHTSNGELYDMYAMTAAHKTLPIPSYVRVTNLQNGKTVVVRVNDRGPFHEGRIVDLSYAAAQRIGIHKAGTGFVEVEIALPGDAAPIPHRNQPQVGQVESALPPGTFLQVGAFGSRQTALDFANRLRTQMTLPVVVVSATQPREVHRVRVGPFTTAVSLQQGRNQLAGLNIHDAHVVYQP